MIEDGNHWMKRRLQTNQFVALGDCFYMNYLIHLAMNLKGLN